MEDLLSLNSSTAKKEARVKKFDHLQIGEYIVKSFKLKETTFGLRVFVEIDDFYLCLPPRFSDKINSSEQIDELNGKKFKMVYGGKNVDEFNKLIIDFKPVREIQEAQELEIETTDGSSDEPDYPTTIKRKSEQTPPKILNKNFIKKKKLL